MKRSPRGISLPKMSTGVVVALLSGIAFFATLWLQNYGVVGVSLPPATAVKGGIVMFFGILAVDKLPPKVVAAIAFMLVVWMVFFNFPRS